MPRRREPKYARLGGVRWHVICDHIGLPYLGRCHTKVHGDEVLAKDVPLELRCRSPRCADQWPAQLRVVS